MKSIFIALRRSLWFIVAISIAVIGFILAYLGANNTDQQIRASLIKRAETVAAAISSDQITYLSGSASDLTNEHYIELKRRLSNVQAVNYDTRFVYIFGMRNNEVFFYADSEPVGSKDYSPPGQIFPEASPQLRQSFKDGSSFIEGPIVDKWGIWISALAPIHKTDAGNNKTIVGIIGMDISNSSRQGQIFSTILLIIGLTCLAELSLLFYYLYLRRKIKNKAAEEDRKMKERQYEFVSMISHQLRTPVSGARAAIEILKDDRGSEIINDAYNKISHLSNIVSTLLFFTENKDVFAREKIINEDHADLAKVVKNQLEFLKKEIIDKKIVINLNLPDKAILPIGEVLLNRIVFSLIENAVIYNKEFGTVEITLKEDSGHPVLAITDSGYGIPEKEKNSIFTAFFRATNASLAMNEGSGLSLYIIKEIMRLVGGSITFTSTEGKGSIFYLNF